MRPSRQFRALYREFLFRVVDLDMIAPDGDTGRLLGQIAALLIFLSVVSLIPALGLAIAGGLPPQVGLMIVWTAQHYLIALTMLAAGLTAVLTWDAAFPDRRDVHIIAPLPVRPRTILYAKIAAMATAVAGVVVSLHCVGGLVWPLTFHERAVRQPVPEMTYDPALPAMGPDALRADLDQALAQAGGAGGGAFAQGGAGGAAIGLLHRGARRVWTYGAAREDSIFEIGSISKTFTGLLLAQSVARGEVKLTDPLRMLLPPGAGSAPPGGREITLLSLATHFSGLPPMPDNIHPADRSNPAADYHPKQLFEFIARHGVRRPGNARFEYSNLGYALLGTVLGRAASVDYEELVRREITGPLGMRDTAIRLPEEMAARFLPGVDARGREVKGWDMDAMAPAGGIRSTAGDMLTYLDAQLHPRSAVGHGLTAALELSQRLQADVPSGRAIGLGWVRDAGGVYWHNGGTGGYSCYSFFDPGRDYAGVILTNRAMAITALPDFIGERMRERLAGEPALTLRTVMAPGGGGALGATRMALAYWVTMLASAAFVFLFVMALQGAAEQILPRRWFLRVSPGLQLTIFAGLVGGYMLLPLAVSPPVLVSAQNGGWLWWSPTYWFLGLFQQLAGSEVLAPLARRAWAALGGALLVAAAAYLFAYLRSMRRIAEQPDVAPVAGMHWLRLPGRGVDRAVAHFGIRTLARSRQHRLLLAFYWGLALAVVVFIVKAPGVQRQLGANEDALREPNVPLLVASILVLCASVIGIRVAASLPVELRANWIFRMTTGEGGHAVPRAVRRTMYALGIGPVALLAATVFFVIWPVWAAAVHLVALSLLGIVLVEISLASFPKIPFTCSYQPGKSGFNIAALAYVAVALPVVTAARLERQALRSPEGVAILLAALAAAAFAARWRNSLSGQEEGRMLEFDDRAEPAVQPLDLHRDGTSPV
ncbi:MAG: serine hydrolase domain-containing protein [Bryobacteraceae bacterium]